GIATRPEAISRAGPRRLSPRTWAARWAMISAPPVFSMIPPSMAPRPTSRATLPRVPPMPSMTVGMTSWIGMPARTAVRTETNSREMKAGHFSFMTVNSRTAMATTATPMRYAVLMTASPRAAQRCAARDRGWWGWGCSALLGAVELQHRGDHRVELAVVPDALPVLLY